MLQDQIYKRKYDIEMKKSMEKVAANGGKNWQGVKRSAGGKVLDDKLCGLGGSDKHLPMQSYLSKSSNANMQTTMMTSQIRSSAITNAFTSNNFGEGAVPVGSLYCGDKVGPTQSLGPIQQNLGGKF